MKRVYITQSTSKAIRNTIEEKKLSYKKVAEMVNSNPSTICRICTGKSTMLSLELAQGLEKNLGVIINNDLEDTDKLVKRIEELENENKMLKQLLIDKWS